MYSYKRGGKIMPLGTGNKVVFFKHVQVVYGGISAQVHNAAARRNSYMNKHWSQGLLKHFLGHKLCVEVKIKLKPNVLFKGKSTGKFTHTQMQPGPKTDGK